MRLIRWRILRRIFDLDGLLWPLKDGSSYGLILRGIHFAFVPSTKIDFADKAREFRRGGGISFYVFLDSILLNLLGAY